MLLWRKASQWRCHLSSALAREPEAGGALPGMHKGPCDVGRKHSTAMTLEAVVLNVNPVC